MTGRHSFQTLRARLSPAAQAAAAAAADQLEQDMNLTELRRARQLSQEEIAQILKIGQASVAKLERRTDMYVSTLRRFVEAMGGELEITARFPDHVVTIRRFEDLDTGQI